MRIDANCDGSVSWDEFISFMLCQDQGASIIAEESGRAQFQLPIQMEPSMRCTGHEESVVRVMVRLFVSQTNNKKLYFIFRSLMAPLTST